MTEEVMFSEPADTLDNVDMKTVAIHAAIAITAVTAGLVTIHYAKKKVVSIIVKHHLKEAQKETEEKK